MFKTILEELKTPVTTLKDKAEKEDIKKGAIKLAIVSGILSLIGVINSIISIFTRYSSNYKSWYKSYSKSEIWDLRWDAIKDAELIGTFFKTWLIYAITIGIMALVLFVIAKLLKNEIKYSKTLSMSNNATIVIAGASVLSTICSLFYAPLGIIIVLAATVYSSYGVIFAFRETLEIESTDKLVLVTTAVMVVLSIIVYIILVNVFKAMLTSLTGLNNLNSLTSLLK